MNRIKNNWQCVCIVIIFSIYTLLSFTIYKERVLDGNINNHILSSQVFGTPKKILDHGILPLYQGGNELGWDGQFYYYMSNDLLGSQDTPNHVDRASYRYQRIGLPLYASIVARLMGENWVSPKVYFWSYFCLIIFATYFGGKLLAKFGGNSFFILFWSLSVGTQITLFNALPDAAADSFLIIALWLYFSNRIKLSVIFFAFSALSREVYVLFPSFIFLALFIEDFWVLYKQ